MRKRVLLHKKSGFAPALHGKGIPDPAAFFYAAGYAAVKKGMPYAGGRL